MISNTDANNFLDLKIFSICILITGQEKHMTINKLFNNAFYKIKFKPKLFTAHVKCNGTFIELPKNRQGNSYSSLKFSLNGGAFLFWFAFNHAVHFRLIMALTLEIPSSKASLHLTGYAVVTSE